MTPVTRARPEGWYESLIGILNEGECYRFKAGVSFTGQILAALSYELWLHDDFSVWPGGLEIIYAEPLVSNLVHENFRHIPDHIVPHSEFPAGKFPFFLLPDIVLVPKEIFLLC